MGSTVESGEDSGGVEVAYGEGWDLGTRSLWRPLTARAAADRDAAGLPYVAVYRRVGLPLEVRLVSWREYFAGVWAYDERGRRCRRLDLRLLDGDRLLRHRETRWTYPDEATPEFDEGCEKRTVTLYPDGGSRDEHVRPGRGIFVTSVGVPEESRRLDRPAFGAWPLLSVAPGTPVRTVEPERTPEHGTEQDGEPEELWRAPRAGGPACVDELFRAGTRLATGYYPEATVLAPVERGTLRIPSGRLAIDAPDNFDAGPELVVPVPPGEYVLEEARVSVGYDCEWSRGRVTRTSTPAVRVRIGEAAVASWEMVLGKDHDPRLLGDGEVYGFGTDGASGCFADAGSWPVLKGLFERALVHGDERAGEHVEDSMYFLRTTDPAAGGGTGADLAAFYTTGDGVWPAWAGRSVEGDLVAVVVVGDHDFTSGVKVLAEPAG
ncbi:DUF4241 domain-containing protein [Streptomyces sp. NPDC004787]|uniref:DUF4241 domain-containing protein n=1 Tax=Streptomyces sp. NPDC004787 TaxID=3154291 RepID=UPI0033A99E36